MGIIFSSNPQIEHFRTFSCVHLITISMIILINIFILLYFKNAGREGVKRFRIIIAVILLLLEIMTQVWEISEGIWSAGSSLPLNLCRIGVFVSAAMLLTGNFLLYEVSYFWSLGGALNAIITPTLGSYNFPHFYFFKFFISHDCLILGVLFLTIIEHYRPVWKSVLRVTLITNVYIVPVAVINYLFNGNYLYICENPGKNTLLSFFGPWPEYLLPLWIMGVGFFIVLYLPFAVGDFWKKRPHPPAAGPA